METRRFRSRILEAMGLTSAVLAGCDPAVEAAAPVVAPRVDADVDVAAALEEAQDGPQTPLPPPPTFDLAVSTFEVDRLATVDITLAPPDAQVFLIWSQTAGVRCPPRLGGLCVDMGNITVLADGVADANGDLSLTINIPGGLADGSPLLFQAVAVSADGTADVSVLRQDLVSHPVRACTEHVELSPELVPNDLTDLSKWLVCSDLPTNGACEPSADFGAWDAKTMFSDAIGEVLQPKWTITAMCDETSIVDRCCYKMKANDTTVGGGGGGGGWEGRPFEVAGEFRLAPARRGGGWEEAIALPANLEPRIRERLVRRWAQTAAAEHASVASFSRFNLELMALGAPSSLLEKSTAAIADEIRHARFSYGVASALAGETLAPSALPVTGALDRSSDLEAVLVAAILEGCINETVAAAQVRIAAEDVEDPALAEALKGVAEDEARHAELSWAFVRWVLVSRPELRALAAATFDGWSVGPAPAADPDRAELARFGVLTADAEHALMVKILRDVVRPCADRLLDRAVAEIPTC